MKNKPKFFSGDVPWFLLLSALFFGLLWRLDFPAPMADDLFQSGPAINMASGGDLSNPFLARQQFHGHYFFQYPPVHPYAEWIWLKLFGLSAASMLGFPALMYFIASTATFFFLRRQGAPGWLTWMVPLAVTSAFLPNGLRSEPMAVALAMAGLVTIDGRRLSRIAIFLGFFLLALAAATAPRVTPFVAGFILISSYHCWREAREKGSAVLLKLLVCGVTGGILAFVLFLCMLDFRWGEFWHEFNYHASQRDAYSRWQELWIYFTRWCYLTQRPIFPLLLVLFVLFLRQPADHLKSVVYVLMASFVGAAMIRAMGAGAIWFFYLTTFLLLTLFLKNSRRPWQKRLLTAAMLGALLFANFRPAIEIIGVASGKISEKPSSNYDQAAALRAAPGHAVLVDDFAARYVFDYRVPTNFIYYPFSMKFPDSMATVGDCVLPTDVCILGPEWAEELNSRGLNLHPPKWVFLRERWSYYRQPRQIFIINGKDLLPVRN